MLRSLLFLGIIVPGVYAALRSHYWALLMYLWFALFRPQEWIWIDITPLRLSLVLGVILLVPSIVAGKFPNISHPLSVGMIGFLASAVLSQMTAVQPDVGWQWIDFTLRLFLTCMMLVTLTTDVTRIVGVIGVIAGSLGFHAGKAGFVYAIDGGTRFADGLSGAFVDNNGYALGTVMIMPLLLATAQNIPLLYQGRWLRWLQRGWYLAVPFCALAVVGTYSRGGFLALACAALVYVLLQRRRAPALLGLSAVIVLGLAFVPIPQTYLDRLETIRTYDEIGEDSALSRPHFWRVGVQMGLQNLLGVGLRQYEDAYDQYDTSDGRFGRQRSIHSSHVQVFAELGAPGALIWVLMFAWAGFLCLRVRARSSDARLAPGMQRALFTLANALLTSMAAFVIGGAFLTLALNDVTWLTFALVASLDRAAAHALATATEQQPSADAAKAEESPAAHAPATAPRIRRLPARADTTDRAVDEHQQAARRKRSREKPTPAALPSPVAFRAVQSFSNRKGRA
jgi:probable O-glycosylation ligase (exosortase A-associated)